MTLRTITREEWAAALESGEFQQGTGKLRSTDGAYCCLGVAALLCGVNLDEFIGEVGLVIGEVGFARDLGLLRDLRDRGAVPSNFGFIKGGITEDEENELATENDTGKTFPEIAAMIRKGAK